MGTLIRPVETFGETQTIQLTSDVDRFGLEVMAFTDSWIRRARHVGPSNSQRIVWDTLIPGLGARIYASGKRSFVLRYYNHGRKKLITLGDFYVLGVERARDLARQLLLDSLSGKDPETCLAKMHGQDRNLSDFAEEYLEKYAKSHVKTWRKYERRLRGVILPVFGGHALSRVTRSDIVTWHRDVSLLRGRYEANRCLEVLSGVLTQAVMWGLLDQNPCRGVKKNKEASRARFVTDEELPRLAAAINSYPDSEARAVMWLYLLTGLRKTELLRLRWDDVDLENNCIVICEESAKNSRRYYPRLSAAAREIFENLPRNDVYVFPGAMPGTHRKYFDNPWRRVRKKAGLLDVRLHDLRRTVGSWIVQAGYSAKILDEVLNQKSERARAVYARFSSTHAQGAFDVVGQKVKTYLCR